MAEAIMMPRQGQSVESCIITSWLKQKGEYVEEGDLLFSYETDKAAFDEASPVSGTLLEIFFGEGDEVPVLTTVAVIGDEGEDISGFEPGNDNHPGHTVETEGSPAEKETAGTQTTKAPLPEVHAERKIRISPRARNMAKKMGVSISDLQGSGPNGRIIAADINAAPASSSDRQSQVTQPQPSATSKLQEGATDTPLTNIRKIIASKMHQSLQQSAQLTHHTSADARKILRLRQQIKSGEAKGLPVTTNLNDMVCLSVVRALKRQPGINAHFLGDRIRNFRDIHLGIAVDTERGLMVPALKNAGRYNLGGLGEALRDLAEGCRNGTINPDLLAPEEATFTVSNLGVYDIEMFTPVLNLPQCGILGVNNITYRPGDLGDGTIGFIPVIGLSLTYDHRALDGAPASRFLQELKRQVEQFEPDEIL